MFIGKSDLIANIPYFGECASFFVAGLWALAVILFKKSGESVHPLALNLLKTSLGAILLFITLLILGEPLIRNAPARDYLLLFVSGVAGIGIADTLFFKSLNLLGAGMSAIVDCLYSPFIIFMSIIFLGESLGLLQIFGVVMILSAVLTAMSRKARGKITRQNLFWGICCGAAAMFAMAFGIVIIKPMLNTTSLMWVVEIRVLSGAVVLFLIVLFRHDRREMFRSLITIKNWRYTLTSSVLGGYICVIIWLAGMKYTQASTAAALNQTSNIFIFIFAAVFLKESFTRQRIWAIILAVSGAVLVTFG
ncbi:MAG: DMT family transporter [Fibrobacteria bacterium]|nr:DMT family transporter [Fibrobacteria bacterium]